jgi:sulfate permease, SulP family
VVALLAPESVAFAQIAGVPPEQGLVAAPLTLLAYALIGRARSLAVGATAAAAVLSAATVSTMDVSPAGRAALTAALALATGLILLPIGMLRGGFIVRFLTPEALTGFLFGLAVVVMIREAGLIAGVPAGPGDAFHQVWRLLAAAGSWHPASVAVGVAALAVLLVLERWFRKLPAALLVLAAAWVVSAAAGLHGHGVAVVGDIASVVPALTVPRLAGPEWLTLGAGALGMALILFVMSYAVATRVSDADDPPLDGNREMIAIGAANVLAGLAGGLAAAGSPSASGAARAAGARGRLAMVLAAGLMLLVAAFFTPVFRELPEPALAAVVVAAVRRFAAPGPLRRMLRHDRRSLGVAGTALLGVLVLGLLPGLLIAVGLSFVLFIASASRLHVTATHHDGVLTLRPDGQLFFANTGRLASAVDAALARRAAPVVLLDLSASFHLELADIDALIALRGRLHRRGVQLWFLHLYRGAAAAVRDSELAGVPAFTDPAEVRAP